MASLIGIKVTGPVFSALFLDHVNINGDQEGFLLGEISSRKVDIISDSQISNEKEEINIDINSILPCTTIHEFYNNYGDIMEISLNEILGNNINNVIGWYRFRRNSNLEPLILERNIHYKLSSILAKHRQHLFIFGIFTSVTSVNLSTHSFDYIFLHLVNRRFDTLPISIVNLGDTSHSEYKMYSHVTVNAYLKKCGLLQAKSPIFSGQQHSIDSIQGIQSSLQKNLQSLHQQVKETENSIRNITKDVAELNKKLLVKNASRGKKEQPTSDGPSEGETYPKHSSGDQNPSQNLTASTLVCVSNEQSSSPFWTIPPKQFSANSENHPSDT